MKQAMRAGAGILPHKSAEAQIKLLLDISKKNALKHGDAVCGRVVGMPPRPEKY
ncbi:hypothetical protein [Dyella acidiphila]|uniref:Uncharacterized protein n=1 Tax=Dyella acidiphila TaxID=2775866 RepID=A0ABR9GDZ4_9GAMM|nr:hypothetical protein [Dyella acidiphila]MBE1162272.1 hypothetical protein [Dyella acidiphila]